MIRGDYQVPRRAEAPLVSVIIPVYNTGRYVRECLNSVLNQTYRNIEVICINDGSSDNSLSELTAILHDHPSLTLITQPHRGVSAARNAGLKRATGRYVMFVDSDDTVSPLMVETYIRTALETGSPYVVGNYSFDGVHRGKDALDELAYVGLRHGSLNTAWGKVFDRQVLNSHGTGFRESISLGEDKLFNLQFLQHVGQAATLQSTLYYHRATPGSLTRSFNPAKYQDFMISQEMIDRYALVRGERFHSLASYLRIKGLISCVNSLYHPMSSLSWREARTRTRKWAQDNPLLPVVRGDTVMQVVGLAYRVLGLSATSRFVRIVKRLRQFGTTLRDMRPGRRTVGARAANDSLAPAAKS